MPRRKPPPNRIAVEVLFDGLPEPIDLDLDLERRVLYWTDRGDPPRGNTVSRASMDVAPRSVKPEIVFTHLMEGIGLALDIPGDRMFMTDLGGSLYTASLDGATHTTLLAIQGNLTGVG